jgi:polar amino acid transport system substrate-binding protein
MRKPTIALALVAVLALFGAACGKSSSSRTGAPSPATTTPTIASPAVVADLAPTGQLRLASVGHPGFLAHGNPPTGVSIDLARALARRLGVPLVTTVYPDPATLIAAAQTPGWDVAVLPVTPALAKGVDYSGPVLLIPHTLLVRSGSSIQTLAQADQVGIRLASPAGAGHTAVLAGQLHSATLVQVASDADGITMLKAGQVDAYADGRFNIAKDSAQVPGSRVLGEDFFTARFAMVVAKGHAAGLAYLTEVVEELKASGAVQQAITAAQLSAVSVAPPGAPSP